MNRFADDSSEFDSSEEEDQINVNFFAHRNPLQTCKSEGEISALKKIMESHKYEDEPEEE